MKHNIKIIGKRIYLRQLYPEDVTPTYLQWLKNPTINQFLESRWEKYTLQSLKYYVNHFNQNKNAAFFGIFLHKDDKHIGNIKIDSINQVHKFGYVGILIGEKSLWGKGFATETIKLITQFAFSNLSLRKLIAGIYANNVGSLHAFKKAGFQEIGRLRANRFFQHDFVDEAILELVNDAYAK